MRSTVNAMRMKMSGMMPCRRRMSKLCTNTAPMLSRMRNISAQNTCQRCRLLRAPARAHVPHQADGEEDADEERRAAMPGVGVERVRGERADQRVERQPTPLVHPHTQVQQHDDDECGREDVVRQACVN